MTCDYKDKRHIIPKNEKTQFLYEELVHIQVTIPNI